MELQSFYPIGQPGTPWTDADKLRWLKLQRVQRSYQEEVLEPLAHLKVKFEILQYGELQYETTRYPLYALRNRAWRDENPSVLITGGVHGYETSGVQGALRFAQSQASPYLDKLNILIVPCVSPWGYETINRWNPDALDPNRSFYQGSSSRESSLLMTLVESLGTAFLVHIDLHESPDSDAQEFWPARAARDGEIPDYYEIPDGFFLVGVDSKPVPEFQRSIIDRVRTVTHIAAPDPEGRLIGEPLAQQGVINLPAVDMHLCASITDASYVTTTEVYPDSSRVTPAKCIDAQVAAVSAGLDFVLGRTLASQPP